MKHNFTLGEAVFALAVTLVLVTVTPLAGNMVLENAKLAACADNLRRIGAAEHAYAADNKSFLAMNEKAFIKEGGVVRAATYSWGTPPMLLIRGGYLKDEAKPAETPAQMRARVFRCPEDSVNFVENPITGWRVPYPTISYQYCWFGDTKGLKRYSYPSKTKDDQADDYGLRANIDRDDPGWYIFADLMNATSRIWAALPAEKAKSNHPDAINCLYLGGHVKSHAVTAEQEKHVASSSNRFCLFFEDVE